MVDDNKPQLTRLTTFPIEVTVNGVKVTVTLMLRPGTTVSIAENEQQETNEQQPQGET